MKSILFTAVAVMLVLCANAQWTGTTNIYNTNSGNVGIGTSNPSEGKLQLGGLNTGDNKLVIPGTYIFERVKLGQYGNGAGGLEFINHTDATRCYGMRLYSNADQVPGLQFQYATYNTSEAALASTYATSMFIRATDGNVGIGTTSPSAILNVDPRGAGSILVGNSNTGGGSYTSLRLGISAKTNGYALIQSTSAAGASWGNLVLNPSGGNILIGKTSQQNTAYELDVNGDVRANKIVVNTNGADFVFASSYDLKPLSYVENYISEHKHLPEIESAAEMQKEGLNVGQNQTKLLQKIEELTLYLIEQNKKQESLQSEVEVLKKKLEIVTNSTTID